MHESSMPEAMSSSDLVKELSSNTTLLIERQFKMAKMEAQADLHKGLVAAKLFTVGGVFLYGAVLMLLMSAALAIGAALDGRYWAGPLVLVPLLALPGAIISSMAWRRRLTGMFTRTRKELAKEFSWATNRTT